MIKPALHKAEGASAPESPWRRAVRWTLHIETGNAVRRVLNQGFQLVLIGVCCLSFTGYFWPNVASADTRLVISTVALLTLPICGIAFWLTRRGGVGGALILMCYITTVIAIVFLPVTYADPPVIHVLFLFPALIGALFVAPWVGLLGALIQTLALTAALAVDGWPLPTIVSFAFICALDLYVVMLPIIVVAGFFHRALTRAEELTLRLDAQVAARTAELRRQMTLREQDITSIVHDIRNRMTVVRAEIDELLLDIAATGVPAEAVREGERRVSAAIGNVGNLVDDLRMAVQLDNAALELQRGPVNIETLVRRVADQLSSQAAQGHVQLVVRSHRPSPYLLGDERKLERVIANLLGNAIKYTRQMPLGRRHVLVSITCEGASPGVELLIEDSGPGLDAEALATLGQPFVRLASSRGTEGMGLGIYVSKGIIELHGGTISFSSPGPGSGTGVRIWLPALMRPGVEDGAAASR